MQLKSRSVRQRMKMHLTKLAETVLLQLECFWVLQEIDHLCSKEDPVALQVMDRIYSDRPVTWRALHPLVRVNTGISLLAVPIALCARLNDQELATHGFDIRPEYAVTLYERGVVIAPSASSVLRVFRNAVAHLPDFAAGGSSPNIAFDRGVLCCWSEKRGGSEIVFDNEAGCIEFLRDLVRLCRGIAGSLLAPSRRQGPA